jgi:acetyl esterase
MTCVPDYQRLIDAETWDFIRATGTWYPPETASAPIDRQRAIYDAMCRAFHRGYPPGLSVRDETLAGVRCRIYEGAREAAATVLYLHGGGFVVGGLESHDDVAAEIAERTGCRLVSADYRLAPEHVHPAQFDDCRAVLSEVARRWPGRILVAGDSAGGNLAAALCHQARDRGGPPGAGQVLIYPGLGGDIESGSYLTHARAPMLTRDDILFYQSVRYAGGRVPAADPTSQPLRDTDFAGLPPTLIHSAECDPLCDDGPAYAAHIRAAGGQALCIVDRGLVHGWLRARRTVGRAGAAFDQIVQAIAALARGRVPWASAP